MRNPKGCWMECAAAALALFCTIGLNMNAFSVYIPYLTKLFALTPSQNSALLLCRNIAALSGVYIARWYYEKLDIRLGYTLALLLSPAAIFLYAGTGSFPGLCLAGTVSGLSYGLGGMYPVAILIHRWFPLHESLAMGICAASSGLAITVCSPILTALVENYSLTTAMYGEIGFFILCAVICVLLLRNYPDAQPHFTHRHQNTRHRTRLSWMFFAVMAIGMLNGSFSFLTIHYSTEGFDPYQISTVISVVGVFLVGAKFLLGELFDLWGGYRTNWLFFPLALLSCILFSIGGRAGYTPALVAACCFGIGDAVATVGITAYAKDLSRPEAFAATQQQFQIGSQLGGLACTLVSGTIATITGNYRSFYSMITVLVVFAAIVVQWSYKKKMRR